MFSDSSRIEAGVGATFCGMKCGVVNYVLTCRLDNNNYVFPAELFAIYKTLD